MTHRSSSNSTFIISLCALADKVFFAGNVAFCIPHGKCHLLGDAGDNRDADGVSCLFVEP